MSLPTHLIFKYFKGMTVVLAYQVLLDQLVHLEEMVLMARKKTEENQDPQDQEMGCGLYKMGSNSLSYNQRYRNTLQRKRCR